VFADAYTEALYSILKEGYKSSKNTDKVRQLFQLLYKFLRRVKDKERRNTIRNYTGNQ
jgi:hypothetical protein